MKFAVIGNPIAHSLSPDIHQAFAASLKIKLTYEKLYAEREAFTTVAQDFFGNKGIGLNITAPFKNDAFKFLSDLDEAAAAAQAVNTIHAVDGSFFGYNTDGLGLTADLARLGWLKEGSKILVIGAGGAAQGIIQPLLARHAELTVANRTRSRADELLSLFPVISIKDLDELNQGWDIVINATAAGWQGAQLPVPTRTFEGAFCYDLGYQIDGQTPYVQQVDDIANEASDGLGMLVEQAAEAFLIWHGKRPETRPVLDRLRNPKRQFIAGAICPRCNQADTTYIERDLLDQVTLRACHACQYSEDVGGNVSIDIQSSSK